LPPKSPVEKLHDKEVNRISEFWEETKEELDRTSHELRLLEQHQKFELDQKERAHLAEVSSLELTASQLRDKLHFAESQLAKERDQKYHIESQLRDFQDQLNEKQKQLLKQEELLAVRGNMLKSRQQQVEELTEKVSDLSRQIADVEQNNQQHQARSNARLQEKVPVFILHKYFNSLM
jgi:chromosome segregation ATPase